MCTNIRVALVADFVPSFHSSTSTHIPTALMLTLRPDGRRQRNATASTQIIVSLLGRLSKVCSTLTRAAARRSRPSHRPSIVSRNSTQSGMQLLFCVTICFTGHLHLCQSINPRILRAHSAASPCRSIRTSNSKGQSHCRFAFAIRLPAVASLFGPRSMPCYLIVKLPIRQHHALIRHNNNV